MENFEDFVNTINPRLKFQYKVFCMKPEELIGKEVHAIRAGFGCSHEGRWLVVVGSTDKWLELEDKKGGRYLSEHGSNHKNFILYEDWKTL